MAPEDPSAQALADVMRLIRQQYVGTIKDDKVLRDAVAGIVGGLDEYSTYIPPDKLAAINGRMNGRQCGVGLSVERIGGKVVVIGPVLGSPADKADFRTGDRILEIDGQDVASLDIAAIGRLLDAGKKPRVNVAFERASQRHERELVRDEWEMETVVGLFRTQRGAWSYMLDDKQHVAYVRVREFCPKTSLQLDQVLRELGPVRSIVLDLRDNPGGGLPSAVDVANLFLREGVIVKSVDRAGHAEVFRARPERTFSDTIPVAILVNGHTASAAEIVAGSLWLKSRAVLIGGRTRGKACVQRLFTLPGGMGQISLTTANYLLAGDVHISRPPRPGGLAPDLEAACLRPDQLDACAFAARFSIIPLPKPCPPPGRRTAST